MTDDLAAERQQLIAALLGPAEPELTCEQCFEQIDRYVDLELAGQDADQAVPGMRAHLAGCPACLEDHASLVAYVGSGGARTADPPPPPTSQLRA
jgi:anti-sigma factor RsiW